MAGISTYSLGFHSKVLSMADVNACVVCATAENEIRAVSTSLLLVPTSSASQRLEHGHPALR